MKMPLLGENVHKARVYHWCDSCGQKIRVGTKYYRQRSIIDSDPNTWMCHPICGVLSKTMHTRHAEIWGHGDYWPHVNDFDQDDWQWLSETQPALHLMWVAHRKAEEDHPNE